MAVQTQKKPVNFQTFLTYSGFFMLLSVIIFSAFFIQGKTFIWTGDGFHQHYPFFREYLTILRQFFETGDWQSWDWSIGLGSDTLVTYGYYVIGDPFVYLGLLFPKGAEELAFHVIMFIRIWCVGASFLIYARKMALSHYSALAGSILYAFSHYAIYNVVSHPFFIHPMIFFPLLCLGIEKIFRKESGVLFIIMIAVSAVSNFYFFYMLTWMIFLYALVRYQSAVKETGWQAFFKWFSYFVGLYLMGLLLSAVIFIPLVYGFLNASRSAGLPPISLWLYPLNYYGLLIINSLTPGTIYWTVGGFSVIGLFSLPFLVKRRRERPALFWPFVIIGVMLLFPIFGSLMNGLSGPYNRFTFVLPFYLALATAYFLDNNHEITPVDIMWMRRLLLAFSVLYVGASVVTGEVIFYLMPMVIGWGTYGIIYRRVSGNLENVKFQRVMIAFIALNMATNALNFYLPHGKNAMVETEDYGTIDEAYAEVFGGTEKKLPDEERYRIGVSSKDNHVRNQYAYLNTPGTNSYASLMNGGVADFSTFIESSQFQVIQPLRNGIDDRRIVNEALGIKYMLTDEANAAYLPAGYTVNSDLSDEDAGMIVAETNHAAPFAYVESQGITRSEAEQLHPVQRENLLADTVILEDEIDGLLSTSDVQPLTIHEGVWNVGEGMSGSPNQALNESLEISVEDLDNQMTLSFDNSEEMLNQEVFIYFEGINFHAPETSFGMPESTRYRLRVAYNEQEKSILQSNKYSFSSYFKRENILIHLNEVTEAEDALSVNFEHLGDYSFEKVSVISRPYDKNQSALLAEEKNEQALEIETLTNEHIEGTVTAEESGMLVTTIPYTSGWKVLIDGEEVATEKVNIGFIGVPLTSGEHTVEFKYQTPFLTLGAIMTGIGLVGLIGYVVIYRRKNQHFN